MGPCRDLRVEHLRRPIAVETMRPRFSWVADHRQTAYRLVVEAAGRVVWDSGRVNSPETSLIEYEGDPLRPLSDYRWRVTSWSDDGKREAASSFGTAFDVAAWRAPWIEPVQEPTHVERWTLLDWIRGDGPDTPPERRLRPAQLVRHAFELRQAPVRARLLMTAEGVYSAWIGGTRVGDEVLAPGYDTYERRISVQTYDVTAQLRAGANVLAVALADGWWAGRIGLTGSSAQFGQRTGLTWELHVEFPDGREEVLRPGDEGRSATAPWRYADLFVGERYDARLAEQWTATAFDDRHWQPVRVRGVERSRLVPFRGEPIRRVLELSAVSTTPTEGGSIVDFGQVIAGRVRLRVPALPEGSEVVVEHTETLDADGAWFANIVGINKDQTDVYVSDGAPAVWEPEFTFHGFRYARIRGIDGLRQSDITAIVIASDLEYSGRFESSDARLNRLHENVVWSQRGNFLAVPTDCPQRERAGWTGEMQVFAAAATNNARVVPFVSRWLDNLRADQLPDGRVPIFSPRSSLDDASAEAANGIGSIVAAAGWSDAIAVVPWVMYMRTGDERVLAANYDAILRWIEHQTRTAAAELPVALRGVELAPEQRARQALLFNTGEHFGDWLTPSTMVGRPTHEAIGIAPALTAELVAPMFQVHTLGLASGIAGVLGFEDESAHFAGRAEQVRAAFIAEYVGGDGALPVEMQGMYALALGLDVLPPALRQAAGDRLARLVRENGDRLDTGFLSMPYLLDALWKTGHRDLARSVLMQTEAPSWLYEVDHGATTIWETWDAIAPDGSIRETSFNHYAFGCVDDWLYRRLAGIAPAAAGWRAARIEPDVDCGLERVEAAVPTPYGALAVAWRRDGGTVQIRVDLPFGIDAELVLSDRTITLDPGRNEHQSALSVPIGA